MRTMSFLFIAILISASASFAGNQGESVFEAQRCGVCHKPETGKMNPSLKEIAKAYQGKDEQLIKYLRSEADSVVKPEKADMMKRYVEKTKGLSADEQKALADFLLSHGN